MIASVLQIYLEEIVAICQKYQVKQLYVFGSLVTELFNPATSDADFLVAFQLGLAPTQMGENLMNMQSDLEILLKRKVDLIRIRPFANKYFAASLENTKQLLYAA